MRTLSGALFAAGVLLVAGTTMAAEVPAPSPTPQASLVMNGIEGAHTATLLQDGTVLVIGGAGSDDEWSGSAEVFDPTTQTFTSVDPPQVPRSDHSATRLEDGRVVIMGGTRGRFIAGSPIGEVEIYDSRSRQFSLAGRLVRPRERHTAVLLDDGRVLAVGGADMSGSKPGPVRVIEAYDPEAQRSTKVSRTRRPYWHQLALPRDDGRVLIIGIAPHGNPAFFDSRVIVETFDPATDRSKRVRGHGLDPMPRAAVTLADGRVLTVDGRRPATILNPEAGRFEEIGRPTSGLAGESLTLLDDGRVLVLGGEDVGPATVEIFDPRTETFEAVGALHSARANTEATKLADGTILFTGGYGVETPLGNAEIFDPAAGGVVAYGPVPAAEAAAPTPTPAPVLAPLGSFREGGVVRMPDSGFRVKFPADWSVEVLEPDRDYRTAEPGATWTALRSWSPNEQEACTVTVGVVAEGHNGLQLEFDTDEGASEPYWRGRRRLMAPWPHVEPLGDGFGGVTGGWERRAVDDPGISHDVFYGLNCLSSGERMPDRAFRHFKVLPSRTADGSSGIETAAPAAPSAPPPLSSLGAAGPGGRIEMTGSGFAISLPEEWRVRRVEPDPDIYQAAPGAAWEALRAHAPGRRSACSVHVGIAPLDDAPTGGQVDTDADTKKPYWSSGGNMTLVVPPVRFRQRTDSASVTVGSHPRPRSADAGLPHDVVYGVTCGSDGEDDEPAILQSFEILAADP